MWAVYFANVVNSFKLNITAWDRLGYFSVVYTYKNAEKSY